jgi:hypothetical protein
MENPLLKSSNGLFVANCQQRIFRCKTSNGLSVAAKSATDLSAAKKSATTNLHRIFAVADSVAKLF